MSAPLTIFVQRKKSVTYLAVFTGILVFGSLFGQLGLLFFGRSWPVDLANYLFHVEREGNVSAYFSALLLLFSAFLLTIISHHKTQNRDAFASRWLVLTLGFYVMSFDEACSIHEMLVGPVRHLMNWKEYGLLYFAWVVPAMTVVAILAAYFYTFLKHLPSRARTWFLLSATVFLSGCIGFEMLGGRHAEHFGQANLTYIVLNTAEESFEMVGIIMFIHALFAFIKDQKVTLFIKF